MCSAESKLFSLAGWQMFCLAGDRDDVVQLCCFRSVSSWGLIVHEGFLTHLKPLTKVAGILLQWFCSSITHRNRCWHSDVASPPQGCHTFPTALDFHVAFCLFCVTGRVWEGCNPQCQWHGTGLSTAGTWLCPGCAPMPTLSGKEQMNSTGGEMAKKRPRGSVGSLCSRAGPCGSWQTSLLTAFRSQWVAVLVLIHVHIPWEGGTELWQRCCGQNLKGRKAEKLRRKGKD